jgi:ribosomal protein L40E
MGNKGLCERCGGIGVVNGQICSKCGGTGNG